MPFVRVFTIYWTRTVLLKEPTKAILSSKFRCIDVLSCGTSRRDPRESSCRPFCENSKHCENFRSEQRRSNEGRYTVLCCRLIPPPPTPPPTAIMGHRGQYALWSIDKISLIECNAKLACKGTLRHVYISLSPRTPHLPSYTLYSIHTCIQYTCSQKEERRVEPISNL